MARDRFAKTSLPIGRLILLGCAITFLAAIFIQNLQPLVSIFFLGQATMPIPLSLAMLVAFISGAIAAAAINWIADWLRRRAIAAVRDEYEEDDDEDYEEDDEETVKYGKTNQQRETTRKANNDFLRYDDDEQVIDVKYIRDIERPDDF
ncbi:lipopolysaccharide assembly protein LapA domain-containing protein [Tumidithrix elongata RA019]|uniref:Lipopolysaccharide assembly protein LapA domain-containing protein n=1 Tax=Tumidithrix elongata BACA0141 TaxID=2716417 RepID=A0AAW9PTP3_9CYAN|nr:lipopolysaccharide assembly protein LapA domain-containing protein [Tumidithrix elongata RA019]